jgi:hypothetical protein
MVVNLLERQQVHEDRVAAHHEVGDAGRARGNCNAGGRKIPRDLQIGMEFLELGFPIFREVAVLDVVVAQEAQRPVSFRFGA